MKKSRKEKKYLKQLQKDMAKACDMKRKELFGKNAPQTPTSIAIDYLKAREKELIRQGREWFETEWKREHPEYKGLDLKWDNLDEVFR